MKNLEKDESLSTNELLNHIVKVINSDYELTELLKTSMLIKVGVDTLKQLNINYPNVNTLSNKITEIRLGIISNCKFHHLFKTQLIKIIKNNNWLSLNGRLNIAKRDNTKIASVKIKIVIAEAREWAKSHDEESNFEKRDFYMQIINVLSSLQIYPEPYYHLKLSNEQLSLRKSKKDDNAEKKNSNQTLIGVEYIKNLSMLLLKSNSIYEIALGLSLATGRRMSEVFTSAEFEITGDFKLRFKGQLKKPDWAVDSGFEIYTLVEPIKIVKALEKLRSFRTVIEVKENSEKTGSKNIVNRKFQAGCNRTAKLHFQSISNVRSFTYKDSRAIWLAMVIDIFYKNEKEWSKIAVEIFAMNQLGHDSPDIQIDYKSFRISEEFEPNEQIERKISTRDLMSNQFIDKELVSSLEDEVINIATSDEKTIFFNPELLLNAHIKLIEFISKNGGFKYQKSIFKRTVKNGGIGLTPNVADAYVKIITDHIANTK